MDLKGVKGSYTKDSDHGFKEDHIYDLAANCWIDRRYLGETTSTGKGGLSVGPDRLDPYRFIGCCRSLYRNVDRRRFMGRSELRSRLDNVHSGSDNFAFARSNGHRTGQFDDVNLRLSRKGPMRVSGLLDLFNSAPLNRIRSGRNRRRSRQDPDRQHRGSDRCSTLFHLPLGNYTSDACIFLLPPWPASLLNKHFPSKCSRTRSR